MYIYIYLCLEITRQYDWKEKTIMLVGATGSGKSTLIDGFINYLLGVDFADPFRFRIVTLEKGEKKKDHNQVNISNSFSLSLSSF